MNDLIKAPFGVVTAFPDDPNPIFSSHSNSQESLVSSYKASSCSETELTSCTTETVSKAKQTERESFNPQSDTQLTKNPLQTGFAIAEFEQQNKALLQELNYLKLSFRCANQSRTNAKFNADSAESELELSDCLSSDIFEENKEIKQQLDEVTSKG